MISVEEAIKVHTILIEKFGGRPGIKNISLLESALNRPYVTFDGNELLPEPEEKAAAILESLCVNHAFNDGNKRIAYVIMRLQLLNSGLDIDASEDEKYAFVIDVASGKIRFDQILLWIKKRIKPKEA